MSRLPIRYAPSVSEVGRLLGQICLQSTWGKRDYLMILFLCHTGLRIGEMSQLQVRYLTQDEIFLPAAITKTKHSRTVPLHSVSRLCVRKLLEFNRQRGFSTEPTAPLFPWKDHGFLPIREAERTIQKLREAAGLSPRLTPHSFRHLFATRLLHKGVDLPTVQSLLGHSSIVNTTLYTHTSEERRKHAVHLLAEEVAA